MCAVPSAVNAPSVQTDYSKHKRCGLCYALTPLRRRAYTLTLTLTPYNLYNSRPTTTILFNDSYITVRQRKKQMNQNLTEDR